MSVVSQSVFVVASSHKSYHKDPKNKPERMVNFNFATANITLLPELYNIGRVIARAYRKNGVRIRRRLENGRVSPQCLARSAQDHLVYNIGYSGGLSR